MLCCTFILRRTMTSSLYVCWEEWEIFDTQLAFLSDQTLFCYGPGLVGFTIEYLALWEDPGVLRLPGLQIWIQNILLRSTVEVEDTFKGRKNQCQWEIVCGQNTCISPQLQCKNSADFKTRLDSTFTAVNYKSFFEY